MMLHALYELARREGLAEDPDYQKLAVHFVVRIDERGRLLALVPTQDERGRGREQEVPRLVGRSGNKILPRFFVDNAKYVLGLAESEGARAGRTEDCVAAFRTLVVACAEETGDTGARAVLAFLDRRAEELPRILGERPHETWTGSEVLAFSLDSDGARMVHERPAVRAFWRRRRGNEMAEGGSPLRCLVTGEMAVPERLHPTIKGVPGAQPTGAMLISFNKNAFEFTGLQQGANAPLSRPAAVGYAAALNWLLERTPTRRFRSGVWLGDGAVVVFWARERAAQSWVNDLLDLTDPSPDTEKENLPAVRLGESPWHGQLPAEVEASAFYAVTLGANAARLVVRDWLESTVAEVKKNVERYFADLAIAPQDGRPLSIGRLLDALDRPGGDGAPPDLGTRLFQAALGGRPFPRQLLALALQRFSIPPGRDRQRDRLQALAMLIKATLLRLPGCSYTEEVTVSLDENNDRPAYLYGRLFAILERLQGLALGDINATIRDRYFGAAARTPALIFGRLLPLSVHHLSKARGDSAKAGIADWLERSKSQVMAKLPGTGFAPLLALEEQGLFAIGYYHQRERFFERRTEGRDTDDEKGNDHE